MVRFLTGLIPRLLPSRTASDDSGLGMRLLLHHFPHLTLLQGRFSLAARYHSTVAEIYENELLDFEEVHTHACAHTHTHTHTQV